VLGCMAFTARCLKGVAKIPYKTLWILFPSPPPNPTQPLIGKQEETKREKNEIQKL